MSLQLKEQIASELSRLTEAEQQRVLEFIRTRNLSTPPGGAGQTLVGFVGLIPTDDLAHMARVIEEECERIDESRW